VKGCRDYKDKVGIRHGGHKDKVGYKDKVGKRPRPSLMPGSRRLWSCAFAALELCVCHDPALFCSPRWGRVGPRLRCLTLPV
jgi:hypothetical protein